ncbi:MAG: glutathione S-transferase family protein [Paracoccaceae bacterium]
MGVMIEGRYLIDDPQPNTDAAGTFERARSTIRDWITADGPYVPEHGRYHLYAAWNCPWAHRALIGRAVLGLQDAISVSYARPNRTDQGWVYDPDGAFNDPLLGVASLHQVYARQTPAYTGRLTVPVLWDKKSERIVNNESADILRMLLTAFDPDRRYCPEALLPDIDRWNALIYAKVNNGVYRAGFARTQAAYDIAVTELFDTLDQIETHLQSNATLTGDILTEADLRLFPTLARFDVAYHYAFKCNIRRLKDYPQLWDYARAIYAVPGITDTVNFDIYKRGYFSKSELRNPLGIVPKGPMVDWSGPTERNFAT